MKKWLDILPESGTVGILGRHQYGKSALSYHIAEERHRVMGKEAVVLGPPLSLRDRFPDWIHIVTDLRDLRRYHGHTVILDESSWSLHARQTMAKDHIGFDKAMSVSVQLNQLCIFCTHHARKLDPNVVTEYEVLAWKMPKRMHTLMERREIRRWAEEARDALLAFPPEQRKAYTYVLYDDLEEVAVLRNPLPSFWCEEIRTAASRALLDQMAVENLDALVREREVTIPEVVWCKDCGRPAYMLDGQCERCEHDRLEKQKGPVCTDPFRRPG